MRLKLFLSSILLTSLLAMSCSKNSKPQSTEPTRETDSIPAKEVVVKKTTIHLTKAEFLAKVVNYEADAKEFKYLGDKPALVDFYADWCGPCKVIAPILEELAAEYGEEIYIYKVDTDTEQELASVFGIRSIPSLLFIPINGKPVMKQGALPKEELKSIIDQVLLSK